MRLVLLHQTLADKKRPVLINNESVAYVKPDSKDVTTIGLTGGQLLQVDEHIDDVVHQLSCDHEANFNLPCSEEIRECRKDEKRNMDRIAELEDQVRAEREMVRTHFAELQDVKAELAALKAKLQDVPPLYPCRVIKTAQSYAASKVMSVESPEGYFWSTLRTSLENALGVMRQFSVKPYDLQD